MDELISKQAAIDAISCDITITGRRNAELVAETIGTFVDRIKALPSAQPMRGKWICTGSPDESWGMMYECSICGNHDYGGNYCSYCGAKMEDENERPD